MTSDSRWKQIDEFPNYWVSNCGQVFNMKHARLSSQHWNGYAYYVQLHKPGLVGNRAVVKLVAIYHDAPIVVAYQEMNDESVSK